MNPAKASETNLPGIVAATADFERWKSEQLSIVRSDLLQKHRMMASSAFPFLRSTFYRWAQLWPAVCPELSRAPQVLAVGDLHVENFGTWRDMEGRLIWGINDFDEAWPLPYTSDLIRLATSALLADMHCEPKAAMDAILAGYTLCLKAGGRPIALAEHNTVLRTMAVERLHQPEKYWQELHELPEVAEEIPAGARNALERLMPEQGLKWHVAHRVAGL